MPTEVLVLGSARGGGPRTERGTKALETDNCAEKGIDLLTRRTLAAAGVFSFVTRGAALARVLPDGLMCLVAGSFFLSTAILLIGHVVPPSAMSELVCNNPGGSKATARLRCPVAF